MLHYVPKALERIGHIFNRKPEHSLVAHTPIHYGRKVSYTETEDNFTPLDNKAIKLIQVIVGIFIYYGITIDNTILVLLNDIAAEQALATTNTTPHVVKLLNYMARHPLAIIEYHASGMVLHIHSDGSYLSAPRARSRASGVHFLSDAPPPSTNFEHYNPLLNGILLVVYKIIKIVTLSAGETEFGTVFINAKEAVPIRTTLEEMGWPQPATPIQVNNLTAKGISNCRLKLKAAKAMHICFF